MTVDYIPTKPAPDSAFILQHLFTAILWVDEALTITWLNAQAEQLLAISSGRLLGQSILALLAPKALTATSRTNHKDKNGHNYIYKDNNIDKNGDEQTCALTERFIQAKQYQQPFIDHDHLVSTPLNDYDLSLPELCADKDQLIQVFLNLINNACESMTELEQTLQQNAPATSSQLPSDIAQSHLNVDDSYQPNLHIQTRVIFQHTIGSQQHKQVLQVSFTDNGSGIDEALISQIFFPMVTSRAAGTGLGLSIVQDIISRHHGMVDVSSNQAQSLNASFKNNYQDNQTRFTLYLPFSQPVPDKHLISK